MDRSMAVLLKPGIQQLSWTCQPRTAQESTMQLGWPEPFETYYCLSAGFSPSRTRCYEGIATWSDAASKKLAAVLSNGTFWVLDGLFRLCLCVLSSLPCQLSFFLREGSRPQRAVT